MCEYCESEKIIFEHDTISPRSWGWGVDTKITESQATTDKYGVFIDTRGVLRLADLDDCNCLEHGKYVKIAFCPFCGKEIKQTF